MEKWLLGVLTILLIVVVVLGALVWDSKREQGRKGEAEIFPDGEVVTVTNWDPRMSDLSFRKGRGKETIFRLMLLDTAVMISKPDGQREIVIDILEPRWSTLFCKGDRLELEKEGEKISMIVNLGPRSCAQTSP